MLHLPWWDPKALGWVLYGEDSYSKELFVVLYKAFQHVKEVSRFNHCQKFNMAPDYVQLYKQVKPNCSFKITGYV